MAERLTPARALIGLLAAAVSLAALGCGSTSSTSQPTASVAPTQVAATPAGASPSAASPRPSSVPPTTSPPTPLVTPSAPARTPLIPGVATISLLTAQAGAGLRPQLAWAPVAGAATYRVTVFAQDGRPYWSWEGSDSSVFFGGGAEPLPDDAPGPRLAEGMTWVVFAGDSDGAPIAASAITPLSP